MVEGGLQQGRLSSILAILLILLLFYCLLVYESDIYCNLCERKKLVKWIYIYIYYLKSICIPNSTVQFILFSYTYSSS